MPRKIRPDSTIGNLAPDLKDEIDEMLLGGTAYKTVKEKLEEYCVSLSIASISDYYTRHLLPMKYQRQAQAAAALDKIDADQVDAATAIAVKQRVWELISSPAPNAKEIQSLYGMVLKAEQISQGSKKLSLEIDKWQRMAAQAILDKALSPEVQAIVGGESTNEEKITLLQALLFGANRKPVTPEFVNQ